jgi:hypothetical protein
VDRGPIVEVTEKDSLNGKKQAGQLLEAQILHLCALFLTDRLPREMRQYRSNEDPSN